MRAIFWQIVGICIVLIIASYFIFWHKKDKPNDQIPEKV